MQLDAGYWNNRYLNDDFGWDAGSITAPLKEYIDQLNDATIKILIPGAGNSYEAEYLTNKGFANVFVLDFAAEPLANIQKRVPDFPAGHLLQQDFFDHQGQYDLILEQTFFCAIDPALRAQYAKHTAELLKPGGVLAGVLFDCSFEKKGPPFGGNKAEYENYFYPYYNFDIFGSCYNSIKPREGRELFIRFIRK